MKATKDLSILNLTDIYLDLDDYYDQKVTAAGNEANSQLLRFKWYCEGKT